MACSCLSGGLLLLGSVDFVQVLVNGIAGHAKMGGHIGHGPAVGERVHVFEVLNHPETVCLIHFPGGLAHPEKRTVKQLADPVVPGLIDGAVKVHLGVHQVQQDPVGVGQRGKIVVDAKAQVVIFPFDGEGGAFGLLSTGRHGQQINHVVVQVEVLLHPGDVPGGTHRAAGDVAVVDGQHRVKGVGQVVNDGFAVGAKHLGDAFRHLVQHCEGFLTSHGGYHLLEKWKNKRKMPLRYGRAFWKETITGSSTPGSVQ